MVIVFVDRTQANRGIVFSDGIVFPSYDFIFFYLDEAPTTAPPPGKFVKSTFKVMVSIICRN